MSDIETVNDELGYTSAIYLADGSVRLGQKNDFVPVPADEVGVKLKLGVGGPPGRRWELRPDDSNRFTLSPNQFAAEAAEVVTEITFDRNWGRENNRALFIRNGSQVDSFKIFAYKPWATFGCEGVNFGKFLPVMVEKDKIYKISVHPFDGEFGEVGTIYGVPEWMDVFPEQIAEKESIKSGPAFIQIGDYELLPIGGPGKAERYMRFKSAAPLGAIPVWFQPAKEGCLGGLINIEKI